MSVDDTRLLEQRLASAGAVTKGGTLVKFVLGRRKRHERFVQAKGTGKEATLSWRGGAARILKTSGGGTWERGLQREQRLSEEELRAAEQRKRKLRAEEPVYFGAPDPQALATALSWRNIDARVLNAPVPGYDDDVLAVVEVMGGGGVHLAKDGARIELRPGRTTIVCSEEEAALMLKEVVIDQLVVL